MDIASQFEVPAPPPEPAGVFADPQSEDEYQRVCAALAAPRRSSYGALIAIVSLAVYGLSLGPRGLSVIPAIVLVVVLLIHEFGHLAAMKLFGYKDLKVFFIPWLGAMASGTAVGLAPWKQAVILLAGPVPGIGIGLLLMTLNLLMGHPSAGLNDAAITFIALNGFNLLPLGFLDGGQLVSTLFFTGRPRVEAVFRVITLLLLGLIAFKSGTWLLAAFVGLVLFGVPATLRAARASLSLRPLVAGRTCALTELPDPERRTLYLTARSLVPAAVKDEPFSFVVSTMRNIYDLATTPKAGVGAALGFSAIWAAAVFGIFCALLLLALAKGNF